jgi:hypothetical protein
VTLSPSHPRAKTRVRLRHVKRAALAGAGLVLGLAAVSDAAAQVACDSLPQPIIYGRGGSAPNRLVGRLAAELARSPTERLTVVYDDDGACYAMASLVNGEKPTATPKYWTIVDGEVKQDTCTLPADEDQVPEATWGSMAQLATTCAGIDALPADVSDTVGPISGFNLFVPTESTQQVISAEAVYYIYGFGPENPAYQVAPWTVPAAIASRTTTSAAGLLLAKSVGIDLSHPLYGTDTKNNQGSVDYITKVSDAAINNPEAAIGFASSETVDDNREVVRTLAFQAVGQEYGYWPDSDATSFDKINIREGRYWLWNPHHFYAKLDGPNGEIADPNVKRWIEYITAQRELPDGLSFLDIQIDVGVIPECAMKVQRDGDVGPLASFVPDEPCGCYYEFKATGVAPDSCQACATEGEDPSCPSDAPVCRHGYCEVK